MDRKTIVDGNHSTHIPSHDLPSTKKLSTGKNFVDNQTIISLLVD
jgi:hypothetical protein